MSCYKKQETNSILLQRQMLKDTTEVAEERRNRHSASERTLVALEAPALKLCQERKPSSKVWATPTLE